LIASISRAILSTPPLARRPSGDRPAATRRGHSSSACSLQPSLGDDALRWSSKVLLELIDPLTHRVVVARALRRDAEQLPALRLCGAATVTKTSSTRCGARSPRPRVSPGPPSRGTTVIVQVILDGPSPRRVDCTGRVGARPPPCRASLGRDRVRRSRHGSSRLGDVETRGFGNVSPRRPDGVLRRSALRLIEGPYAGSRADFPLSYRRSATALPSPHRARADPILGSFRRARTRTSCPRRRARDPTVFRRRRGTCVAV